MSRRKKKEYVTNLEDQINLLNQENTILKAENERLKSRWVGVTTVRLAK